MSGYLETKNLSVGYHGKPLIEPHDVEEFQSSLFAPLLLSPQAGKLHRKADVSETVSLHQQVEALRISSSFSWQFYLFLQAAVSLRDFFTFFALGFFSCFSVDSP